MTHAKALLLCFAALFANAIAQSESVAVVEHRTAELMEQILTAVSAQSQSPADDSSVLPRLCAMVNDIEASVIQMSRQETVDNTYALAHLQAELEQARANLSAVRIEYNATTSTLRSHSDAMRPLPQQLSGAKSREEALMKQRDLLSKECEQDVQGQRFRVDAVKADISVLDQALKHLGSLKGVVPASTETALLEVDENLDAADPSKCAIPEIKGPVVRCQNGYYIPLNEDNATLSTLPPGNGMLYTQKLKCGFRIAPSNAGTMDRIELSFHYLETVVNVDTVEVYDGNSPSEDKLIARFSGRVSPPPKVHSTGAELTVLFVMGAHPSHALSSPGFIASYTVLRIPTTRHSALNLCAGTGGVPLILTGTSGFVAEDARPEFAAALQSSAGTAYSGSLTCAWAVHVLPSQSLRLHFTFLNTEPGADFVTVYDGSDLHAPVLLSASGSDVPTDVFSTGSTLYITYHADYTIQGYGFHASWCINGTSCPETEATATLPTPAELPIEPLPTHNETAPIPSSITAPDVNITYVSPPDYPLPTPLPQGGTCCTNDCNRHGLCNPTTCVCACFKGYDGSDCGVAAESSLNNLLEMESGVGAGEEATMFNGEKIEDECGDDVQEPDAAHTVKPLNLDPVSSLLERLKFELYRSLAYEHDTTNMTKRQCNSELQKQDQDLAELRREVLMLGKQLADMDAHAKALIEKKDGLYLTLTSYQNVANDLVNRIETSRNTRDAREKSQSQELKTLQSMRDLITHIGNHPCTRDIKDITTFNETVGAECYGELLETELHTDDPSNCKPVCSFGCVGFTFHSHEGCRFFSAIRARTPQCAGGSDATCSCFEKS